jgi:hypothetical protein
MKAVQIRVLVIMAFAMVGVGCRTRTSVRVVHTTPSVVNVSTPVNVTLISAVGVPPQLVQKPVPVVSSPPEQQQVLEPQVLAKGRVKLMLYLFCPVCQKYYTWKGGELPPDTLLYFWHPEAEEWQIYGGDHTAIMRQPPRPERIQCPYHR